MDKTLEKFGIYNLLAVLFAGAVNLTISALVLKYIYGASFHRADGVIEWAVLLIMSYVVGLFFQELGAIFQKIFHRNNYLLKKALNTSENSRELMTSYEKSEIYRYVKSVVGTENDNVIYNYCRFYVVKYCDTAGIDRDQSLSAMSRNFFLYFALLSAVMLGSFPFVSIQVDVVFFFLLILLLAVFSAMMYSRYVRFAKLRYVYIYRSFYCYAILGYNKKIYNNSRTRERKARYNPKTNF